MKSVTISQATPPTQHRFHLLDALRGIAALLVVPRHVSQAFIGHSYSGFFAVDFFFCLSGFVVAFAYEHRLKTTMTFREFSIARLIRLYPFAALGTFLGMIEFLYSNRMGFHHTTLPIVLQIIVSGFLMVPFLHGPTGFLFPLDSVMWTLFFELVANFLFALLVRLKLASSWVLGAIAVCSFLWLIQQRLVFGLLDIGWTRVNLVGGIARVGFSFFAGILCFRLFSKLPSAKAQTRSAVAALCMAVVLIAVLDCPEYIAASVAGGLLLIGVVFPVLVYCGARIDIPSQWIPLCAFLGTISYPLYILHHPLLWPLGHPMAIRFAMTHSLLASGIALSFIALVVAFTWLLSKYYDIPIRRKLTSYFSLKTTRKTVLASKG
jgi:peptidoglycan/LPS O-acetylase OafA/YrhL